MKNSPLLLLALTAVLLGSQCKSPRYTPDKLPADRLLFGEGGGFAGIETTYLLLENGQIFRSDSKAPNLMEMNRIRKKTANNFFETAESSGLLTLDFKHPGNLYQFIEFQDDGKTNRVTWGDKGHPVAPQIAVLYEQLMQTIQEKK